MAERKARATSAASESPTGLHAKLNAIMADVAAEKLPLKRHPNGFEYLPAESIIRALRPHMIAHGVNVYPTVKDTRYHAEDGFTEVEMNVTFVDTEGGESYTVTGLGHAHMRLDKNGHRDDRGAKSAQTGALRYVYMSVFMITDEADDDELTDHRVSHDVRTERGDYGDRVQTGAAQKHIDERERATAKPATQTNGSAAKPAAKEPAKPATKERTKKTAEELRAIYDATCEKNPEQATPEGIARVKDIIETLAFVGTNEIASAKENNLQMLRSFFEIRTPRDVCEGAVTFFNRWSGFAENAEGEIEVNDLCVEELTDIYEHQGKSVVPVNW